MPTLDFSGKGRAIKELVVWLVLHNLRPLVFGRKKRDLALLLQFYFYQFCTIQLEFFGDMYE